MGLYWVLPSPGCNFIRFEAQTGLSRQIMAVNKTGTACTRETKSPLPCTIYAKTVKSCYLPLIGVKNFMLWLYGFFKCILRVAAYLSTRGTSGNFWKYSGKELRDFALKWPGPTQSGLRRGSICGTTHLPKLWWKAKIVRNETLWVKFWFSLIF